MIRKQLNKLINWAQCYGTSATAIPLVDNDSTIGARGMTFTVHSASGGHVIEYRHYNEKTDRSENKLHIINHGDDLGERIGQIISLETLRN